MDKENKTSDKTQNDKDFEADVENMYCDCDKPTLGINTCGCGKSKQKFHQSFLSYALVYTMC